MSSLDLTVIIPCYNEETTISTTVSRIDEFLATKMTGINAEILVVDDGSGDATLEIARKLEEKFPRLRVYNLPHNQGRGAAMKAGIANAKGKYLLFLDADLSYDVSHIEEIYSCFQENPNLDVVVVSPYTRGGQYKNIPFDRLVVSRAANYILSGFIDDTVSTVTSMCRGYKTEVIRSTPLLEDGKELHLEILRKMVIKGATIKEIPGRLIWKNKTERAKRKGNLKIIRSARKHLLYGILARPARLLKFVALFLLAVGLYEFFNVFRMFLQFYPEQSSEGFSRDLWLALSQTFAASPHTIVIAVTCTVFAVQALTFYFLFVILELQHRESMAHLLRLFESKS